MPKVFGGVGQDEKQVLAREIFYYVLPRKSILKDEVYRHFFHQMSYDDYEDLIRSLIHANMVIQINKGGTMWIEVTEYAEEYVKESERRVESI